MSKLYKCDKCHLDYPLTLDYFYTNQIRRANNNASITQVGKCKNCYVIYNKNYREGLIAKGLTRKNTKPLYIKSGILYIIGTTPENPVKIGITAGTTVGGRITALQTSHWLPLKVLYTSDVTNDILKLEKELHTRYSDYRVKGEWFNLTPEKIENLIKELQEKNSNP